jgi:hypothetical protein
VGKNSKRMRRQEFPDAEEFEDVKPEPAGRVKRTDSAAELVERAVHCPRQTSPVGKCPYVEGQVVMTPDLAKNGNGLSRPGTIVTITGAECVVLDALGYLHRVPFHQLYPAD